MASSKSAPGPGTTVIAARRSTCGVGQLVLRRFVEHDARDEHRLVDPIFLGPQDLDGTGDLVRRQWLEWMDGHTALPSSQDRELPVGIVARLPCSSVGRRPDRRRASSAPAGAYWRMYALRTSSVRFGPVRCGVSDENTTAPPAATGALDRPGRIAEALVAERIDVRVRERAEPVHARRDDRDSRCPRSHPSAPARSSGTAAARRTCTRCPGATAPAAASRASCRRPDPSTG